MSAAHDAELRAALQQALDALLGAMPHAPSIADLQVLQTAYARGRAAIEPAAPSQPVPMGPAFSEPFSGGGGQ